MLHSESILSPILQCGKPVAQKGSFPHITHRVGCKSKIRTPGFQAMVNYFTTIPQILDDRIVTS